MVRYTWLLAVISAAFAGVGTTRLLPGDAVRPAEVKPAIPHSEPVGSVGCSASACHGKPDQKALTERPGPECWKSSATIYHALDPHGKAYDALLSPLGKAIAARLRTGIPAHEDIRCLACHTNPTLALPAATAEQITWRSEGVGCEACHGNASLWKAEHTAWTTVTDREAAKDRGFNFLNLASGQICAGCHVGAPASRDAPVRDMNHDMIAAGHPALDKSGWTLKTLQPKHYFREMVMPEHVEALMFAQARDALAIDRKHRSASDPRSPWPEFAEIDCKKCHHPLAAK